MEDHSDLRVNIFPMHPIGKYQREPRMAFISIEEIIRRTPCLHLIRDHMRQRHKEKIGIKHGREHTLPFLLGTTTTHGHIISTLQNIKMLIYLSRPFMHQIDPVMYGWLLALLRWFSRKPSADNSRYAPKQSHNLLSLEAALLVNLPLGLLDLGKRLQGLV